MTEKIELKEFNAAQLTKRALIGAGIALLLIALFLLGVDEPDPAWPKLWFIRPLIVVQLAGALGGAFYHVMESNFSRKGWSRVIAILISLIGYIIVLWIGSVLGLDGTLWD